MPIEQTYLHHCLKDGKTVRWPDRAMPISVYIAPFRWYEKSKQQESTAYNGLVMECFNIWQKISADMVKFRLVTSLNDSQINVVWRRVDRTTLGHCEYLVNDKSLVYSAEISIGISDGRVHARYNDMDEVRHTILHEIGHALGLTGHSDGSDDIMYAPHQFGVVNLSPRDIVTLQWLYKLPIGFNYQEAAQRYQLEDPFTFHDVLNCISGKAPTKFQETLKKAPPPEQKEILVNQHDILSERGKFFLATQNIQLPKDLKTNIIVDKKFRPPT